MNREERRRRSRQHRPPRRVQKDRKLRQRLQSAEHIAVFPAASHNNKSDIEDAMQASHDALIDQLGDRRRSGVTWMVYAKGQYEKPMQHDFGAAEYDGLRSFLASDDEAVLVVAFAEADPIAFEDEEGTT